SGCVVGSVTRAARRSQSCQIGWHLRDISVCVADNKPVRTSPQGIRLNKHHRTAKIRRAHPIHPPCADGHYGDYSACAAGCRPEPWANTFCGCPPSLPGISARSAVFCRSRQEVRESSSSRRFETADSVNRLSAGAGLAPGAATQPWPMDGAVPFASRSQTKLPGGSPQRPFLLLRLWPRWGRDSLRGTLSPGEVPASLGVAAPMARCGACVTGDGTFLWHAVTPPQRGGCLSVPTRSPLAGTDRAYADRLR